MIPRREGRAALVEDRPGGWVNLMTADARIGPASGNRGEAVLANTLLTLQAVRVTLGEDVSEHRSVVRKHRLELLDRAFFHLHPHLFGSHVEKVRDFVPVVKG